jgi:catechol 2,3-dioxygenase-like lactoylglutathione lyase family enzyme
MTNTSPGGPGADRPETVPFRLAGLDHIVLRAIDPARMIAFYRDVLGCTVERSQPELGLTQLRAGRSLIDLIDLNGKLGREGGAGPGIEGRNLDHFCLGISPFDEAELRAHLARHHVSVGEAGLRYGAEGEGQSIYIEDPEANRVELKASRLD